MGVVYAYSSYKRGIRCEVLIDSELTQVLTAATICCVQLYGDLMFEWEFQWSGTLLSVF